MEDIIYSRQDGFFKEEGFYIFKKPLYTIKYKRNTLFINNHKIKTSNPIPIIEKLIKGYYSLGFISYDFKEKIYGLKKYKKENIDIPLIFLKVYKNYNFKKYLTSKKNYTFIKSIKYPDKERFINIVKKSKNI